MAENPNTETAASDETASGLSQANQDLLAALGEVFQHFDSQTGVMDDFPQVTVGPADTLEVCRLAKSDPRIGMEQLLCLAAVDYKEYFQLVYILHSLEPEKMLAVKTDLPYNDPRVSSVASVWRAAEWYEREAHDLFGVVFDGHPDLSPLLLYDGFEGYPGRKDFPFNDYQEF